MGAKNAPFLVFFFLCMYDIQYKCCCFPCVIANMILILFNSLKNNKLLLTDLFYILDTLLFIFALFSSNIIVPNNSIGES